MSGNIKIVKSSRGAKLKQRSNETLVKREFILDNLSCAHCTSKIEAKVSSLEGVHSANINFATKILTIEIDDIKKIEDPLRTVTDIVNHIESKVKVREKINRNVLKKEMNSYVNKLTQSKKTLCQN